uniref:Ig-like domain-containing protein n=1 Tax=Poecilia formosa TaxID=48698 RepID=A0A087X3G3_POEFO
SFILMLSVQLMLLFSVYRVEVDSGVESVLLPFKTTVSLPKDVKVTWTNDSGRIVHMDQRCSCNSIRLEEQYRLYRNRTEMKKRFNLGDFSLILKNPTDRDSDTYTCSITNSSGNVLIKKQVLLNVKASQDVLTVKVEVDDWEPSVVLPCQYSQRLEEIVTVKWSRLDLNPNIVHQRQEADDLRGQNELFKERTSMRPEALDSGDFSLTLTEPQVSDSGVYIC